MGIRYVRGKRGVIVHAVRDGEPAAACGFANSMGWAESDRYSQPTCLECRRKLAAHIHTRDCYDDAGPGAGGVSLVCGLTEGE